ncbi:MAG: DUF6483 family protein [Myxococcota bacterium]|nr:DUF6483 family protein [Myxococcota bacterium]
MTASKWVERKTQASKSLLQQGSEALRSNNIDLARAALTEAAIVLDMVSADNQDVLELRAQAFNELGVVHQRGGDLETARNFHHQAAQLCEKIVDDGLDSFRGNAAATHLNLSNICAAMGDGDAAIDAVQKARVLTDQLLEEGEGSISMMRVAVYLTVATLEGSRENYDEADEAMTVALASAREIVEAGNTGLYVQAVQGAQQLSVILFQNEEYDRALRWGKEAEELSEQAFEALGQEVVSMYVVSQINLISYNEKLSNFADAEDSLWKAIELVGNDPRLLERGQNFYEFCRKQADSRLEEGNLPREEVEQGYADILERIEEIGGLPEPEEAQA